MTIGRLTPVTTSASPSLRNMEAMLVGVPVVVPADGDGRDVADGADDRLGGRQQFTPQTPVRHQHAAHPARRRGPLAFFLLAVVTHRFTPRLSLLLALLP